MSNSYRLLDPSDQCDDLGATLGLLGLERKPQVDGSKAPTHVHELASTIESSIIPRLLVSHGLGREAMPADRDDVAAIDADMVIAFANDLVDLDSNKGHEFVQTLIMRGVPLDRVLIDLMAPAARLMGELWTADHCSFMDVTLGVSRIQQILRSIQGRVDVRSGDGFKGRLLLAPSPGEQHTFGLRIAEEFFLRDGWEVRSNLKLQMDELIDLVTEESFDIVGLSLSAERLMDPLVSAIQEIRRKSMNRQVRIMIGGVLFVGRPDLVKKSGADVFVLDAREAVLQANEWSQSATVS